MERADKTINLDPLWFMPQQLPALKRLRSNGIYNLKEWAPEIHEMVEEYLIELSDDDLTWLVWELSDDINSVQPTRFGNEVSSRAREDQIASIIATHEPREIARAAHYVAVRTAPSLEALIESKIARPGSAEPWPRDYLDIGEWLDANTTVEQRFAFAHEIDPTHPVVPPEGEAGKLYIVDWLEMLLMRRSAPTRWRLLEAWEAVSSPKEKAESTASPRATSSVAAIRAWANENGLTLAKRGRIPTAVIEKYQREFQLD